MLSDRAPPGNHHHSDDSMPSRAHRHREPNTRHRLWDTPSTDRSRHPYWIGLRLRAAPPTRNGLVVAGLCMRRRAPWGKGLAIGQGVPCVASTLHIAKQIDAFTLWPLPPPYYAIAIAFAPAHQRRREKGLPQHLHSNVRLRQPPRRTTSACACELGLGLWPQ